MDRETLTSYSFLTIATLLMALLLAMSTPVGNRMITFTEQQIDSIIGNTGVGELSLTDDNYGTLVVHYRYTGSAKNIDTYKATLRIGETCIIPTMETKGYTVKLENGGTVPSSFDITQKFQEIVVCLTPQEYNITFVTNGGSWESGTVLQSSYMYGTLYNLPDNLQKSNYKFVGWFEDSGLGGTPVKRIDFEDFGDKTFYAKFSNL